MAGLLLLRQNLRPQVLYLSLTFPQSVQDLELPAAYPKQTQPQSGQCK